jgi:hypothetical protein
MPLIIGLMGQKRSGKDTFAERLVAEHGFVRLAFADALKKVALDIDPLIEPGGHLRLSTMVEAAGWEAAKTKPEVRRFLQELGLAVRRNIHEDEWVDIVFAELRRQRVRGKDVVITDVRFPNEANDIQIQSDGFIVRIDRPGLRDDDAHVSEHAWREIWPDAVVTNSGSVEDLHVHADALVNLWKHLR